MNLQITEDLTIKGVINGNVTVLSGGHQILHGSVCKNFFIEEGASATIYGVVEKDVNNRCILSIFGTVNGYLVNEESTTYFSPSSVVEKRFLKPRQETKQLR